MRVGHVAELTRAGLDRFGGLGSRPGQVAFPTDVAIDAADRIYVAEKGNNRVQVFVELEGAAAVIR